MGVRIALQKKYCFVIGSVLENNTCSIASTHRPKPSPERETHAVLIIRDWIERAYRTPSVNKGMSRFSFALTPQACLLCCSLL